MRLTCAHAINMVKKITKRNQFQINRAEGATIVNYIYTRSTCNTQGRRDCESSMKSLVNMQTYNKQNLFVYRAR